MKGKLILEKIIKTCLTILIILFLPFLLIIRLFEKVIGKKIIRFNPKKKRSKYGEFLYRVWLSEKEKAQNNRVFVYFLLPSLSCFVLFVLIPFMSGIWLSLTDWTGLNSGSEVYIGFANYKDIFTDFDFLYSFYRTIVYAILNIFAINLVAFGLALLVTQKLKLKNLFRAGFFMPNLIGGLVLGYIWQFIYNRSITKIGESILENWLVSGDGALATLYNSIMTGIGQFFTDIFNPSLISQGGTALWGLIVVVTWQYAGYIMMIYIAALQNVPQDLIEASSIDGASAWQKLRHITFPLIAQSFTIAMFLTLTTSFKQFDTVVSLTQGGPALILDSLPLWMMNIFDMSVTPIVQSTELIASNIYETAFTERMMGAGQAKAIVFFFILLIISIVQVRINQRREVEL